MVTKEQKLMATERFLRMKETSDDGRVINLEDDMTYADFAVIDNEGIGIVYVTPDNDTEYRVSRSDFERDALKVLSHYGDDKRNCDVYPIINCDVYPIIITFMFIDDDDKRALIRCHHRPPFKEEE